MAMICTVHDNPKFQLRDGKIHIWSACLDVVPSRHQWHMLSGDERQRAGRFMFERDRNRYVVARSTLRTLLGRYLSVAPEDVSFAYGPHSKPELAPPLDRHMLHFNVSHSHGQFLVATARGSAIGVDIEKVRPEMEFNMIAKRFFSSDEFEQLSALDSSAKCLGFFNAWTRKEAYLKAKSEGIGYGLDQFSVSLVPGKPARLLSDRRDPEAIHRSCIRELAAPPGYAAAVSAEPRLCSVKQFTWEDISLDQSTDGACAGWALHAL